MSRCPRRGCQEPVSPSGQVTNASMGDVSAARMDQRLKMLGTIEQNFIQSKRGDLPQSHKDVYSKAVNLMTSKQMEAFKVEKEDNTWLNAAVSVLPWILLIGIWLIIFMLNPTLALYLLFSMMRGGGGGGGGGGWSGGGGKSSGGGASGGW